MLRKSAAESLNQRCQHLICRLLLGADQLAIVHKTIFRCRRLFIAGLMQGVNAGKCERLCLAVLKVQLVDPKSLMAALAVQNLLKGGRQIGLQKHIVFLLGQAQIVGQPYTIFRQLVPLLNTGVNVVDATKAR